MSLGALHTAPTATSAVQSTFLASSCTGTAPTSYSYNADGATGCGLDGAGDVSDAPQWRTLSSEEVHMPAEVLDAVDAGRVGCGEHNDIASRHRPAASAPGAPVRCDIGALEQQ